MNARRWVLMSATAGLVLPGCALKQTHFGEPMKLTGADNVPVERVLADPAAYDGKELRLVGKVDEVCAHKGCWITLGAPGSTETIFVKFTCPVEGRLIPMDAAGHQAVVEGTLEIEEITEADARHYAEDRKASPEEIAKIVGPQKRVRMKSPSAKIKGI